MIKSLLLVLALVMPAPIEGYDSIDSIGGRTRDTIVYLMERNHVKTFTYWMGGYHRIKDDGWGDPFGLYDTEKSTVDKLRASGYHVEIQWVKDENATSDSGMYSCCKDIYQLVFKIVKS